MTELTVGMNILAFMSNELKCVKVIERNTRFYMLYSTDIYCYFKGFSLYSDLVHVKLLGPLIIESVLSIICTLMTFSVFVFLITRTCFIG